MGALDPKDLLVEDAEAMASTVARATQAYSTPLYKEMVVNCISQVCGACVHDMEVCWPPLPPEQGDGGALHQPGV